MPGLTAGDSGVRVVVTPSQSSYFAGEPFSVTITFTNTRTPDSRPSRALSNGHKRGAHSISSAPLARPPTSPGTPRTPLPPLAQRSKSGDDTPTRKGLIGRPQPRGLKGAEELPELIEQRRKRLLAKSLSVSISPHELEEQVAEGTLVRSASFVQQIFKDVRSPTSPHVPSPLARSDTLPLASNHPHARKHSVFDGQPLQDTTSPTTSSVPALPYTPSSSTSTFSLALDPIAESSISPYPSTPAFASPTIETPSTVTFVPALDHPPASHNNSVYAYPPPRSGRRPSQLGLGQPPSGGKPNSIAQTRSAFSSTFPQSSAELILYSYAQLTGTLSITPVPGSMSSPDQVRTLNSVRAALLEKTVVGGGSMDITSSLHHPPPLRPAHRRSHSRSSSISSGFLALLSPSSLVASSSAPAANPAWTPSHRPRASSSFTSFPVGGKPANGNGVGLGLGIPSGGIAEEDIDPELPLPTFEVQPAMLAVDMSLLPGESRSYTYTVQLPDNLPPTFKGRSLKFSYELVVGTCRAGPAGGGTSTNSISRVMKVPIRVYNNVVVGRTPQPYDILWPVATRVKRTSSDSAGKVVEQNGSITKRSGKEPPVPSPLASSSVGGTFGDLQDYAHRLLESFPDPGASGVRIKLPAEGVSPVRQDWGGSEGRGGAWEEVERERAMEEVRRREREREREEEGGLTGCREAVEVLTRNPKKASYDVNKDGVKVAVLTFTKSSYRLGETILGVVELNERTCRSRVLKLSAMLEAQESLPSSISPPSSTRHLRRVHAEHHSSFALSTLRTTFSLDIPSDASPAFNVRVGQTVPGGPHVTVGGLEWKVRLCLLVAVAAETSHTGTEGVRMKNLARDGPRGEWGSSWRAPSWIAPMEKPQTIQVQTPAAPRSWAAFFAAPFLGSSERGYHDGDEEDDIEDDGVYDGIKADRGGGVGAGVNFSGGEEGWKEVRLETVECEVPIKVWPGNTAFKAVDVVFDV